MPKIVPIVEGPGEVSAVPVLLRKILDERGIFQVGIARPKNAHGRSNLDKPGGLEKFIQHAWREQDCGAVLVLVDADDDCPKTLATSFAKRATALGVRFPVVVACARRMYEAWLIASFETTSAALVTHPRPARVRGDVESISNPKGWITSQMPRGRVYKETIDQEGMTVRLDIRIASPRSRSFRRLIHAVEQAVDAIDGGLSVVYP